MITCKLCGTELGPKMRRKDGSMLCPVCGQIYWKAAVDRATTDNHTVVDRKAEYARQSRRTVELLKARMA